VFHNRRWDADFLTLRRLIAEDALGEVVQFESHFDRYRPALAGVWKEGRDAGVWQDLGPHLIDQSVQLFGLPRAVTVDLGIQRPNGPAPDYAHALLSYGRLRVILHMSQFVHANGLRFAVHGTHGSFIKHGLDSQEAQAKAGLTPRDANWGIESRPGQIIRIGEDGLEQASTPDSEWGDYRLIYAGLRDAVLGRGPNPVPPEQAIWVMQVLEAGRVSAAERREVML
jgi:predicted dehydrogenase